MRIRHGDASYSTDDPVRIGNLLSRATTICILGAVRMHAVVERDRLVPLDGRVFLNGRVVNRATQVRPGDTITIAGTALNVEAEEAEATVTQLGPGVRSR